MAICRAARKSRGLPLIVCVAFGVVIGGCASRDDYGSTAVEVPQPGPVVPTRGKPVDPAAARILDTAPSGTRLDYRLPDGGTAVFTLGPIYDSGLQVPCRVGRARAANSRGESPAAYPFCKHGAEWYAMPPVVLSGY